MLNLTTLGPFLRFLYIPELRRGDIFVTFEEFAKITAGAEPCFISDILYRHFGAG